MAMSTFPRYLALGFCVSVVLTNPVVTSPTTASQTKATDTPTGAVDIKAEAAQLVIDLRGFADLAKQGMALSSISEGARKMGELATELLQQLPEGGSGCERNSVIKMAATRIGDTEILALLQAEDKLDILNGRLALSFAFLESVAQLIEDELALSTNIRGHLSAIVFGAGITNSIAQTSDVLIKASSSKNKTAIKRQWSAGVTGSYSGSSGFGASGNVNWKSKNTSFQVDIKAEAAQLVIDIRELADLAKQGRIRLSTKIAVYRAVVLSALLYCCETWTNYRRHVQQLEQFHQRCLRKIYNIKWQDRVPSLRVLGKCGLPRVECLIIKWQLR